MNASCARSLTKPRMNVADVFAKSEERKEPAIAAGSTSQRGAAAPPPPRGDEGVAAPLRATNGISRYGLHSATPIVAAITHGEPASASDIARNVIAIVIASGENDANMKRVIGR